MSAATRRASGGDASAGSPSGRCWRRFPAPRCPRGCGGAADAGLGGVCLYGSNRDADVAAVAAGLHAVRADVVVALDEEGGDVTRLEATTGSSVPGNAALGAIDDEDLTRGVGRALGTVLLASGIDLDLAPCADVNSDPDNPVIGVRSFGADPALVARHVAAFTSGLQEAGVAACAKHFPGHGATAVDSHLALPTVAAPADVLRDRELVPFRAAIAAGVRAVMPGHLLVPALDAEHPATVSRRIVTDLLRGELGFTGLVVTDALDMGGAGGPDAIPTSVVAALVARRRPVLPGARQRRGPGRGVRGRRARGRGCGRAARGAARRCRRPRGRPARRFGALGSCDRTCDRSEPRTGDGVARTVARSVAGTCAGTGRRRRRAVSPRRGRGGGSAAGAARRRSRAGPARRRPRGRARPPRQHRRRGGPVGRGPPAGRARPDRDRHAGRRGRRPRHRLRAAWPRPAGRSWSSCATPTAARRRPRHWPRWPPPGPTRSSSTWAGPPTRPHRPDVAAWVTTHGASRASGEAAAAVLAGALATASTAASGRTSRG